MKTNVVSLTYEIELEPGEDLILPESLIKNLGAGRWIVTIQPVLPENASGLIRDHTAFLNGYSPEDEGLYDDYPTG
jgi:hypothetical protein